MTSISQNPQFNTFVSHQFSGAAQDQQINKQEGQQLLQAVGQMDLSSQNRAYVEGMIQSLQNATTGATLFGGEKAQTISPQNRQIIENLAQSNTMAAQLLNAFDASAAVNNRVDPAAIENAVRTALQEGEADPASVQFQQPATQTAPTQAIPEVQRMRETSEAQASTPTDRPTDEANIGRPSWYVNQYNTGLRSSKGDCGPTSASMIVRSFGYHIEDDDTTVTALARSEGRGPSSSPWAMGESQVTRAVERLSEGQIGLRNREEFAGPAQAEQLVESIRESLARGERPILLSGQSKDGQSSRHYQVVVGITHDGKIRFADPAMNFNLESESDPAMWSPSNNESTNPIQRFGPPMDAQDLSALLRRAAEDTDNKGTVLLSYGRVQ